MLVFGIWFMFPLYPRIKNVNLDQEKDEEMNLKKKEARKQKLLEKNNISRQETYHCRTLINTSN